MRMNHDYFEEWLRDRMRGCEEQETIDTLCQATMDMDSGEYVFDDPGVQAQWEAWQACLAAMHGQPKHDVRPVNHMRTELIVHSEDNPPAETAHLMKLDNRQEVDGSHVWSVIDADNELRGVVIDDGDDIIFNPMLADVIDLREMKLITGLMTAVKR